MTHDRQSSQPHGSVSALLRPLAGALTVLASLAFAPPSAADDTGAAVILGPAEVAVADNATAASPTAEKSAAEKAAYVRIDKSQSGLPRTLDTAIVQFTGRPGSRYEGQQVDLFGVIHVGEKSYYEEVQRRLNEYDVVLYELVAPNGTRLTPEDMKSRDSVIAAAQGGMTKLLNLEFQLEQIDYLADNFRHADMSPDEFMEDMESRGDQIWKMLARSIGAGLAAQQSNNNSMAIMMAMGSGSDRPMRMKQAMAQQLSGVDIATAGLDDRSGENTLIKGRNRKAFEVLREELGQGHKTVAVFYGAGHLQDMAERLERDFEMQRGPTTWLPAWDLQSN